MPAIVFCSSSRPSDGACTPGIQTLPPWRSNGSYRAIPSTWHFSITRCPRWTGSRWPEKFAPCGAHTRRCSSFCRPPANRWRLPTPTPALPRGCPSPCGSRICAIGCSRRSATNTTRRPARFLRSRAMRARRCRCASFWPRITRSIKRSLRLLERLGCGADVVGDGRQALARLDHAAYDVILMDVQMPEMDGLEASRAICARWAASERPRIIAMTAEAMQGDRDKCLAAGMDDYVMKPVTLDRLGAALAKCRPLAARTAPKAAAETPVENQRIGAGTALDRDVLDQLREDLGGTAALREVIRSFLDQTPSVLSALRDAAARADVPSIRRAAHMIKGTSSILGARELSEQCAEIDRVGQTGCIADAGSRAMAVEASYRTIEAALKAEIERLRP